MTLIKSISGIRGTIGGQPGEGLTPVDIIKYTSAFAQWIKDSGKDKKVVMGRDARPSGEALSLLVSQTLVMSGLNVVDLGITTTPTVEIAVTEENAGGGIILTASHNPIEWNALKLINDKGEFISSQDGTKLLAIADSENFSFAPILEFGSYLSTDKYLDYHIKKILDLPLVDTKSITARKFKVVVDAVNSSGGIAIPELLKALGVAEVRELHCEPNGSFPHNPEPLPENLGEIREIIENGDFDLGIVVDPDVDRLAMISENGEFFGEEYTLVAVSDYVLQHDPGNTVSNLSSTQALAEVTRKYGGQYFGTAVGEVNVVMKMKEVNASIGGEGNGGVIYPDLHYGRDALVGIALFLSSLAKFERSASELRATFPNYFISKNKIELRPDVDVDLIFEEIKDSYASKPINTIDGLWIGLPDQSGWIHLRKSNTEPIIRVYAESDTESKANNLASQIMTEIQEVVTSNL